jgi:hypothetical protein
MAHVTSIFWVKEYVKQETSRAPLATSFYAGFFVDPKDGSDMFLRNDWLSMD